jgi:sialidase-1
MNSFPKNILPSFIFIVISISFYGSAKSQPANYLFKNRKSGYKVYRIPTVVKSNSGTILSFCEGRQSLFDNGNIDIVMKKSTDNGKTWSALKVVWNEGNNTCGNPSPVIDRTTGDIIILATMNNDKVFELRSKDEGEHWEIPKEITQQVKLENWRWYATGPVHALQLFNNKYKNRIVVPCNHTTTQSPNHISHIIYSDDAGSTWKLGGNSPSDKTDECTVAELSDGKLLLNMRNNDRTLPNRKVCYSENGGESLIAIKFDSTLIEPICQASMLNFSSEPNILLFANPSNTKKRKNLTLSVSIDDAHSWQLQILVNRGKSAYSDLVKMPNENILIVYETGKLLPYSGIVYKTISKEIITNNLMPQNLLKR